MPAQRACLAWACAFAFLFSCGTPRTEKGTFGGGDAPESGGAVESVKTAEGGALSFRVETVAGNLEVPWSIAFAPDGRMLFTERPGRVRVYEQGRLRPEPLATIEDVETSSESGLMGLALHPRFDENRQLYLAYAYKQDGVRVRVVRFRETGTGLAERKLIIEGIPAAHYPAGTRLRFGPDGKLYITTGDSARRELAQRLDSLAGKTLRLNDDGTVPPDNPFVKEPGARPEIWSLGHRNSQGLDFQPSTGLMFQTEHGPSGFDGPGGGDELNIVERGKNYGWPPSTIRRRAPAWNRRSSNTPRRSRPRAERFTAARPFHSSAETSSSATCAASASSASSSMGGASSVRSVCSKNSMGASAKWPKGRTARSTFPPPTKTVGDNPSSTTTASCASSRKARRIREAGSRRHSSAVAAPRPA